MLKKNIAKRPDATSSIVMFAVRSVRIRKTPRRTSGAFWRCSIATNALSRITATTPKPIVLADVQPTFCTLTIP